MKQALRRWVSRLLQHLVRSPRIKWAGQKVLGRFPRLRSVVLRLMHGGALCERTVASNEFDTRGEYQQRLMEDLQQRWKRHE